MLMVVLNINNKNFSPTMQIHAVKPVLNEHAQWNEFQAGFTVYNDYV